MAVTTPAVPASTVPVTNTTGQNVDVALSGFTLTVVAVNGVTVGSTNTSYPLPPGATIAITYTVAGTWAWTDPLDEAGTPQTPAENLGPYNEETDEPEPPHGEGGETGLGVGIAN